MALISIQIILKPNTDFSEANELLSELNLLLLHGIKFDDFQTILFNQSNFSLGLRSKLYPFKGNFFKSFL